MAKPKPIQVADDQYPNAGEYFSIKEPKDQVREREQEESDVERLEPLLKELIAHWDERIKGRDSIDAIEVSLEDDPGLHQKMMHVNQLMKEQLQLERSLLVDKLDTYRKR